MYLIQYFHSNQLLSHASGKDHGMPQKQSLHHRPSFESFLICQKPDGIVATDNKAKHGKTNFAHALHMSV